MIRSMQVFYFIRNICFIETFYVGLRYNIKNMFEKIQELYNDVKFLKFTDFDDAIIGIDDGTLNLIYSKSKIMEILLKEMDYDEAIEHYGYNIVCAYFGEKTPVILDDEFED